MARTGGARLIAVVIIKITYFSKISSTLNSLSLIFLLNAMQSLKHSDAIILKVLKRLVY